MPPPRIGDEVGRAAVDTWSLDPGGSPRSTTAMAVRYALQKLADAVPGNAVEVRVPPFGVTQCLPGPRHTRGTPPAVVETDQDTWLELVTGRVTWESARTSGRVQASGERADLAPHLPLLGLGAGRTR